MCQLRDYKCGDEDEVFNIVDQVLSTYKLKTSPETTDADLKNIGETYVQCGGAFRILECEGRTVGSYGLYPTTDKSCELRKMYLLPEFRARKLGKRMMEDAIRIAKNLGFVEMTLETNSRLKEAIGLYKAFGFKEYIPNCLSDRCDSAMKKAL